MTNIQEWKANQEVNGSYCGVKFEGRINSDKSRRSPGQAFIFAVTLDQPITVFGEIRGEVEIWSNDSNSLQLA